jgi:hypothetical protein
VARVSRPVVIALLVLCSVCFTPAAVAASVAVKVAHADAVRVAKSALAEFSGFKKTHTEPDGTVITEELSNATLERVKPCHGDKHLNEEFGTSLVCVAIYKSIAREYTPTRELNDEIIYGCSAIGVFGPFNSRPEGSARSKVFPIGGGSFIKVGRLVEKVNGCPRNHPV